VSFHGPVRVPDNAAVATATATLSFDGWKGAAIAPSTHSVTVRPRRSAPVPEPVARSLIASLPLDPPLGGSWNVAFSPDGTWVCASCYPFGTVQIWDAATRKELNRIAPPPGYGTAGAYATADYALPSADWKTLYIPVLQRTSRRVERDGKKSLQVDYAGFIRVWDVAAGKDRGLLRPADGAAPSQVRLDPGGRFLVCVEQHSHEATDTPQGPTEATVVWDLATGEKSKLCDGSLIPGFAGDGRTGLSFGPGGKSVLSAGNDYRHKTSTIKVLSIPGGEQLARLDSPEKGRYFYAGPTSPDGSLIAVYVAGKPEDPQEMWFLGARTLDKQGQILLGKPDPEQYGWGNGQFGLFTPDGQRFVALGDCQVLVWDIAGHKLERSLPVGDWWRRRLALSPDGKTLAVAWMPKDRELESELNAGARADQKYFPQPRISLIDLAGDTAPRTLIAPHGRVCGLAFCPAGNLLAFAGGDAVHLFDLRK
jgi:WD40 repeat protein